MNQGGMFGRNNREAGKFGGGNRDSNKYGDGGRNVKFSDDRKYGNDRQNGNTANENISYILLCLCMASFSFQTVNSAIKEAAKEVASSKNVTITESGTRTIKAIGSSCPRFQFQPIH